MIPVNLKNTLVCINKFVKVVMLDSLLDFLSVISHTNNY